MYGKIEISARLGQPTVRTGHQPRKSGAGKHGDKRLKRMKTRDAQRRHALAD